MRKPFLLAFLFTAVFGTRAQANTITANSCNTADVQSAINSAAGGDTVAIPAGTCAWTTGVSLSGITLTGAGSPRIIARDNGTDLHSVRTGTLTLNIKYYSSGFSAASISPGQTLLVFELGAPANFMQGTVTSIDTSTNALVMNITTTGGSATNVHRWEIAPLFLQVPLLSIVHPVWPYLTSPRTRLFTLASEICTWSQDPFNSASSR